MLEGRKFRLILLGVINNLFWGGPFDCNIPYLTSYCNSNGVDLDADIALKKYVKKTFVGCRLSGIVVNVDNISEKSRFIVDQFNKGEKGAGMGIVCRGWDVEDLAFIRACSQRKASCCAAG